MVSKADRHVLEAQTFMPESKASYESTKSCLTWSDEFPEGLSGDGCGTDAASYSAYWRLGLICTGVFQWLGGWSDCALIGKMPFLQD